MSDQGAGVAKLIKIQMQELNEWGVKLIISAANYDHELIEEWEFSDEQKAKKAFDDLSSKAICQLQMEHRYNFKREVLRNIIHCNLSNDLDGSTQIL